MQSLREKLLKAGLVSEEAAKKAEIEKASAPVRNEAPRRDDRPARSAQPRREGPGDARPKFERPKFADKPRFERPKFEKPKFEKAEPRIPKLPPMAGSKEANRLMSRRQLELDKQIRDLVLANQVAIDVGASTFYFVTRKNKLRRLELTQEQAGKLEHGELGVVERPDPDKIEHALVPPAIAEQVLALSPRAVRFLNKDGAQVGFLSEAEIGARAAEATSGDEPEVNEVDVEPGEEKTAAAAEPGPFITIKRAPLP
jgi:hypothetical protein